MVNTEHLKAMFGRKLGAMSEVTDKTGYETALTVCGDREDGSEHAKQPVLGSQASTHGSNCEVGTDPKVTIHTHNSSPPSRPDLRRLSEEDQEQCVLVNRVEETEQGIVEDPDSSLLVCMDGDDLDKDDIEHATREKGEGVNHITDGDIDRLEEVGIDVGTSNI